MSVVDTPAGRGALLATVAVLALAAAFGTAVLGAFGPSGWWVTVVEVLGWLTAGLLALVPLGPSLTRWRTHPLAAVGGLCVAVGVFLLGHAVNAWALHHHGRSGSCLVLDETTSTRVVTGSAPNGGGGTETETDYAYRLSCPPGGPGEMTTRTPVASKGDLITVAWDTTGHLPPRPASTVEDTATTATVALAAAGFGLPLLDGAFGQAMVIRTRRRRAAHEGRGG